jgi:hypothetical protein
MLTFARALRSGANPSLHQHQHVFCVVVGDLVEQLTPRWSWDEYTITIIADGVNEILNGIAYASSKDNMFFLYNMDWRKVVIEEGC